MRLGIVMDGKKMSQKKSTSDFLQHSGEVEINGQPISVLTEIKNEFKEINYRITSSTAMEPITVALTLFVMCKDVASKLNLEIEDLNEGLVDNNDATRLN